jgi:hypothetical protein
VPINSRRRSFWRIVTTRIVTTRIVTTQSVTKHPGIVGLRGTMAELSGVPERPRPGVPAASGLNADAQGNAANQKAFDPLRLCIYTTVALLTWAFGPFAVVIFAAIGLAGYWRAHQAGLTRTKCYLRDVRLVLLYLGLTSVGAVIAIVFQIKHWLH